MKKLIEFVRRYPGYAFIVALCLSVALWYSLNSLNDWRLARQKSKQDAQIQKQIDQNAKDAESSETNANTHRDQRESAEGRTDLANEQREQARAESDRTLEPVRKARQRYEEARKSRPADFPSVSDDELCAELAKRQIPCR